MDHYSLAPTCVNTMKISCEKDKAAVCFKGGGSLGEHYQDFDPSDYYLAPS